MPRSALSVQSVRPEGTAPTYSAANVDGHSIPGTGDVVLHVKNASAASMNVTVQTPGNQEGLAIADQVVAVPASGERFIGRFRPTTYTRDAGADVGQVYIDFSAVASVTVAALGV